MFLSSKPSIIDPYSKVLWHKVSEDYGGLKDGYNSFNEMKQKKAGLFTTRQHKGTGL